MDSLVIDCPICEAKSHGEVLAQHIEFDDLFGQYDCLSLVKCPACNNAAVVLQSDQNEPDAPEYRWGPVRRVWPRPQKRLSQDIPESVRKNVEEAEKCLRAGAYNACAVMCGRALESVSHAFGTKKKVLAGGLQDLRDAGVIDRRLYEWGDALRSERNIGAHASNTDITKQDATDLVEFTNAICEYVFVLTARFDRFMERKQSTRESPPKVERTGKLDTAAPGSTVIDDDIPF